MTSIIGKIASEYDISDYEVDYSIEGYTVNLYFPKIKIAVKNYKGSLIRDRYLNNLKNKYAKELKCKLILVNDSTKEDKIIKKINKKMKKNQEKLL